MHIGRVLIGLLFVMSACGGQVDGRQGNAASAAGSSFGGDAGGSGVPPEMNVGGASETSPSDCPATVGASSPMPSPAQCSAETSSCSDGEDTCIGSPWSTTLGAVVQSCNAYCGEISVAVHAGCVLAIQVVTELGVLSPYTREEVNDCVHQGLIGHSWNCQPSDRWVRVYVGSCTTK